MSDARRKNKARGWHTMKRWLIPLVISVAVMVILITILSPKGVDAQKQVNMTQHIDCDLNGNCRSPGIQFNYLPVASVMQTLTPVNGTSSEEYEVGTVNLFPKCRAFVISSPKGIYGEAMMTDGTRINDQDKLVGQLSAIGFRYVFDENTNQTTTIWIEHPLIPGVSRDVALVWTLNNCVFYK